MKKNLCLGKRRYDTLDSIDHKYRQMHDAVIEGTLDMTHEQVTALKRAEIAAETTIAEPTPSEPREQRNPEDRKLSNGWTKDGRTGEVREPECGNVTYWGETS